MQDAFIPNDLCAWQLTSNCKVIPIGDIYAVVALKRRKASNASGKRMYSTKYDDVISAKNNAFDYRYSIESKLSRKNLDEYKTNLRSNLSGSITNTQITERPPKRMRPLSSSLAKKYSMSGSLHLNLKVGTSSNPNNTQPNSCTLLNHNHHCAVVDCALVIQRAVRNKKIRRARKMMKQTLKDQTYRQSIVRYLSSHISNDTCYKLLLGADDTEILSSFSSFDKKQARIKAIHIADALQALIHCTKVNGIVTWKRCCEIAIEKNYNQIKCARTIMDWYIQLHETNLLKFRRSKKGRAAYFMKSPFAEDESLTLQFKSWARSDLEHLSVKKAWYFINLKLLNK